MKLAEAVIALVVGVLCVASMAFAEDKSSTVVVTSYSTYDAKVVQKSQNLDSIARLYGCVSWKDIWSHPENRKVVGKNPNKIYPGQKILVPVCDRVGGDGAVERSRPGVGAIDPTGALAGYVLIVAKRVSPETLVPVPQQSEVKGKVVHRTSTEEDVDSAAPAVIAAVLKEQPPVSHKVRKVVRHLPAERKGETGRFLWKYSNAAPCGKACTPDDLVVVGFPPRVIKGIREKIAVHDCTPVQIGPGEKFDSMFSGTPGGGKKVHANGVDVAFVDGKTVPACRVDFSDSGNIYQVFIDLRCNNIPARVVDEPPPPPEHEVRSDEVKVSCLLCSVVDRFPTLSKDAALALYAEKGRSSGTETGRFDPLNQRLPTQPSCILRNDCN